MYNALVIAKWFIDKGSEDGVAITPMKLIKLVYIAHGWYLGLFGKKLIDEHIQAWKYGPVIKSIYREYKSFGSSPIRFYSTNTPVNSKIDDEDVKFLEAVWVKYSRFDGAYLSALTHMKGTPWDMAYIPGLYDLVISPNNIEKYYTDLYKNSQKQHA